MLPGDDPIEVVAAGSSRLVWDATAAKLVLAKRTGARSSRRFGHATDLCGSRRILRGNSRRARHLLDVRRGAEPHRDRRAGVPAAPVYLNGCVYGAWAGAGEFVRDCAGDAYDLSVTDRRGASLDGVCVPGQSRHRRAQRLRQRHGMDRFTRAWSRSAIGMRSCRRPTSNNKNSRSTMSDSESLPDRSGPNTPPVAENDTFGARAGRTTILPVIDNDYDLDGDVLTATVVDATAVPGEVQLIRGGSALQVVLSGVASGTFYVYLSRERRPRGCRRRQSDRQGRVSRHQHAS